MDGNRSQSKSMARMPPRSWRVAGLLALILAVVWAGADQKPAAEPFRAAEPRPVAARGELMADEQIAIRAFSLVSPSVVFIRSKQVGHDLFRFRATEVEEDAGSGFIWDANGYIVTNYHVVENSDSIRVTLSDQSVREAHRVGSNPDKDIAVLKVEAPPELLPPIPIGTSRNLQVGQRVFAVGNPFGYDQTLTSGVISGLGREIKGAHDRPIQGVIQTDAPLNPGNSGGPLLDSAGHAIGMNTAILSPTGSYAGIGFAIPIDSINRIVPQIIRGEKGPRPRLSAALAEDHLVRGLGLQGVLILTVSPRTAAAKAGLQGTTRDDGGKLVLGDLIVAVDGRSVETAEDLYHVLDGHKVGDAVQLTIQRQGKKVEVSVELAPVP